MYILRVEVAKIATIMLITKYMHTFFVFVPKIRPYFFHDYCAAVAACGHPCRITLSESYR